MAKPISWPKHFLALRRSKGWSQRDAARRIGVSQNMIIHWERDLPRMQYLPLIARAFGMHWLELLRPVAIKPKVTTWKRKQAS